MTKTKPMTDFNWGKKFTELQEKQGKLGTQKSLISRSFIAHAIDQAKAEQRETDSHQLEAIEREVEGLPWIMGSTIRIGKQEVRAISKEHVLAIIKKYKEEV